MRSSRRSGWAFKVLAVVLAAPIGVAAVLAEPAGASPNVTQQPTNQTVNEGQSATFSAASDDPIAVPQWQLSTDGGTTWTSIAFADSDTYTTPPTAATDNGNEYRVLFNDIVQGTATSNPAVLTVDTPPVVTQQPADATTAAGEPVTFQAAAVGRPNPTLQWQVSRDGGNTFADIPGSQSPSLTLTPGVPDDANRYRAVFSNGAGVTATRSAALAVTSTAYRLAAGDGSVLAFGSDQSYGSMGGQPLNAPIVGMAATRTDRGYWLVASDGGIFGFGDAGFYGSTGAMTLNKPVVGMAPTPDGLGYWLVASDGGIFAYGDAGFYGSTGAMTLNKPVVGMAPTPDGLGYWLVASDGGIFAFGDAGFYGSTGAMTLAQPVIGMAATPDGQGYWLVASDGGVFCFGDAGFYGSTGGQPIVAPIAGLARTADGTGYWMVGQDGSVYGFGDAPLAGSGAGTALGAPFVSITR